MLPIIVYYLLFYIALSKTQWSALVTARYMITMMVLLCYVNLSGMSLECIVIVLMKNSLLGGQECTDYVNIQLDGDRQFARNRQAIIPRLNFTCNGRITSITAKVDSDDSRSTYPFFQVWRLISVNSTIYNKTGEVQLSDDEVTGSGTYQTANIILTGNNRIEVQSGDVVGYYHPSNSRYRVRDISTDGYVLYRFDGSPAANNLEDLSQSDHVFNYRQPLLQFAIGM